MELWVGVLGVAGAPERADHLAARHVLADVDPYVREVDEYRGIAERRGLIALNDHRQAISIRMPRRPSRGRVDDRSAERRHDRLALGREDIDPVVKPDQLSIRAWLGMVV